MINGLMAVLERPRTVIAIMLVMVVAGILSYRAVPKEANPDVEVPVYFVNITQQGISPRDAERLLVKPMESALRGLDGLKELTAIAAEGNATIVLEFTVDTEKAVVLADIREKVDQAAAELPSDADEPIVSETSFALLPTIVVTLSGQVPERTLTRLARSLSDEIEAISTVREANINGNREELLEVELDLMRLESYDITQDELLSALNRNNQLVPAGFLDNGESRFNVKVPGLVESADDVFSIVVKQNGEGVVTLGDVAEIKRTYKQASSFTRVNGNPAISIDVVKRTGTNIISNNDEVRAVVEEFTKDWPETIKVDYLLDQSSFIYEVLGSLESSILTAIVLVMICVVAALGIRSGLLVGMAIPISFMIAFMIVGALGMVANMMVMFGMVLCVGMLVDSAIVVTEYADRKIAEGLDPDDAYKRSARLMFWPVISSTATTLAAFLPLLLWPGVPGEFMAYLPRMVIIVLTASLLTALVFLPVTGALIARFSALVARRAGVVFGLAAAAILTAGFYFSTSAQALGGAAGIASAAIFLATFAVASWLFTLATSRRKPRERRIDEQAVMLSAHAKLDLSRLTGLTGAYARLVNRAAGSLIGNIVVVVAIVGITVATFMFYGENNQGVEFFVEEEPDVAIVLVSARGNLSATDIRDLVREVEHEVLRVDGVDNVVMNASAPGGGSRGGSDPISGVQDKPADVVGELQIELADYCCRREAAEIFEEIRQRTANLGGMQVEVRKIEGGPPTGKDMRLEVKSTNYDTMVETVRRIRDHVDTLDIFTDVEDGRPLPGIEWQLSVDREQAGRYNASIQEIGAMVQLVTNGVLIGNYRPDDSEDEVEIRVRLPEEERTLDQFEALKLRTPNGQVPLSNFITQTPEPKVSSITRRDGLYAMDVKANLAEGAQFDGRPATADDGVRIVNEWLEAQSWPENVQLTFRGADEEQKESEAFLGRAALGALFMMFIILLTQFNSFYQTLLTLSTVIMAVTGVLIGMLVTGQTFSIIMTGTGIVALAGIVVNNAIILIDTFNRLREDGIEDVREAVVKTAAQRLRPILLTTGTTILGLIPMATQVNFDFFSRTILVGGITSIWWVQLSTAIISGLAFSTLLTLVFIPSMLALPGNLMRVASRMRRSQGESAAADSAQVSERKEKTEEPDEDQPYHREAAE